MENENHQENVEKVEVMATINLHCDVCSNSIKETDNTSIYCILDVCNKCEDNLDPFICSVAESLNILRESFEDKSYRNLINYSDEEKGQLLIFGLNYLLNYPEIYQKVISNLQTMNDKDVVHSAVLNLIIYKGFISSKI